MYSFKHTSVKGLIASEMEKWREGKRQSELPIVTLLSLVHSRRQSTNRPILIEIRKPSLLDFRVELVLSHPNLWFRLHR